MNDLPAPFQATSSIPVETRNYAPADMVRPAQGASPLDQLVQLFWRRKWMVAAITTAFFAIGIYISATASPKYSATARLQIDRGTPDVVKVEALGADGMDWEFYQTQYELLRSRRLSAKVVDTLALDADPSFLLGAGSTPSDLDRIDADDRREMAINRVNGSTTIEPVEESKIVDIRYRSDDPQRSADIANALADQYIEMDIEQKFEATARLRGYLENKLKETRVKLEQSEREAADYAQGRGIVTVGREDAPQSIDAATLESLNNELSRATAERVAAEAALRAGRAGRQAANTLENETISSLRGSRARLQADLSKLESDFGPEYPAVAALRAQIGELDRQIGREEGRIGSSTSTELRGEYNRALRAENALRARVSSAKGDVLQSQQQQIGLNILQRDIDTNRELYDGLLEQYKAVGVSGASTSNRVTLVDSAQVPSGPSSPNIPMNLAIALMTGLASSVGVVLFLEQMKSSRLTPETLPSKLHVPLLGNTPKIEQRRGGVSEERHRRALSEAYYSALTAIRFKSEEGFPRSVFVTSSRQYEGKSTSAAAIATDLASLGSSVVLMDVDMRAPSVHRLMDMPLDMGVSDYLSERATLASVVRETKTPNLSVILAGSSPMNPAQLLSAGRLKTLVDEATAAFDFVVIDGPPVLGLADAPLIARVVEGTIFVVESNRTPAMTARAAIDRLVAVNARIVGALMTKYDPQKDGYGYSYGGGYGYGDPYAYGD